MRQFLLPALLVSLCINAYLLLARDDHHEPPTPTFAPTAAEGAPRSTPTLVSSQESDETQVRLKAVERALAELREKHAPFEHLDPGDAARLANVPLAVRLRMLLPLSDDRRRAALWKLGNEWSQSADRATEVLRALHEENDPEILRLLAELIRAGAASAGGEEARQQAIEILGTGQPAERRLAAAYAALPRGRRAAPGDAAVVESVAMIASREPSADVLGALAEIAGWGTVRASSPLYRVFEERWDELPTGDGRRLVLAAVVRAEFGADHGERLWERWGTSSDPTVKTDLTLALAGSANAMVMNSDPKDVETTRARQALWRDRIPQIYAACTDLRGRQDLLRATQYGLSLGLEKPALAQWVRTVAELEPDAAQRERILRWATAIEGPTWANVDDYIYERR